jgi:diaminopimelate epimerase
MISQFYKYQGAGNDFIIVDDRSADFLKDMVNQQEIIELLCNRRFGIGADGLMLLRKHRDFDFQMIYFNSDGRESTMCGNGGRCLVAFAWDEMITGKSVQFIAADGPHFAEVFPSDTGLHWVSLQMKDVNEISEMNTGLYLDTGSPHFVQFCDDVDKIDVYLEGKRIRNHSDFGSSGTNVNFVQVSDNRLYIRTFERGVEDETLACGTGITAAAIAAYHSGLIGHQQGIEIIARGGQLKVSFNATQNKNWQNVYLEGPAKKVFKGEITL